jgi:hypothetical protein
MKRLLILFVGFIASFVGALFWANSSYPLPPLPKFVWELLYQVTRSVEPSDVHAQEGVLSLLGTWLVLVLAIAAIGIALALTRYGSRARLKRQS